MGLLAISGLVWLLAIRAFLRLHQEQCASVCTAGVPVKSKAFQIKGFFFEMLFFIRCVLLSFVKCNCDGAGVTCT